MFKKFNFSENIAGQSQLKSSVQRNIRAKLGDEYPGLETILDDLIPKKQPIIQIKGYTHPNILPKLQVDRGAIKFVLSGANIMCPGLTSKGARMDENLPAGAVVAIMAEGKENALAIGQLKMSTEDIKKVNKGIGVDNIHYLTDPLWKEIIHIHPWRETHINLESAKELNEQL
ncbi:hypothetical protein RO3G_05467 [Rhizopus delemar RA 99-880]|uniref:Translation machinery-associated protein 20 n=1 Tax=Rhizopus delemar (strain RA 99-880 / ATCC MYA-4621 / FGSC 9543 / NRRL 43880) TaxID=246409 RepID=I1BX32_RHIO9|nr:hypothetical protein RO3G_05467 [Rhizopus delemar RA 99-880]|eukprot:EIE80762.1 hypothetical protein RO3G_05467 [Rhizopus delemar RA 99-880]